MPFSRKKSVEETGARSESTSLPPSSSDRETRDTDRLLPKYDRDSTISGGGVDRSGGSVEKIAPYMSFGSREATRSSLDSRPDHDGNAETDDIVGVDMTEDGSSIWGCTVNMTNAIMGAGCIGYGGAMAQSGGLIFIILITVVSVFMKLSFDLLVRLQFCLEEQQRQTQTNKLITRKSSSSQTASDSEVTYESLAVQTGCDRLGLGAVLASKGLFSLGCMVAYIVIIRDNLASGLGGFLEQQEEYWGDDDTTTINATISMTGNYGDSDDSDENNYDVLVALLVCIFIMLPLCLLRKMSLLEKFSQAKIVMYGIILVIVVYLFFTLPPQSHTLARSHQRHGHHSTAFQSHELSFAEKWLEVKTPNIFQNMGTIVLSFEVAQNIHMLYRSLHPKHQNLRDWGKVTTRSISLSYLFFLGLSLFAYMTYWDRTNSDLFLEYPSDIPLVSVARIFLSVSMLFTYPMPMLALREMMVMCIQALVKTMKSRNNRDSGSHSPIENEASGDGKDNDESSSASVKPTSWAQHCILTVFLWLVSLAFGLSGLSLGQVLNLIGCVSGTLICFILPAIFSFRVQGVTVLATVLMVVGSFVTVVGTWYNVKELLGKN